MAAKNAVKILSNNYMEVLVKRFIMVLTFFAISALLMITSALANQSLTLSTAPAGMSI